MNTTPVLKWVGGKRELLPQLRKYYSELDFNNYFEPFFGGGAVYLDIINIFGEGKNNKCYINDVNSDLINMYRDVKDNSQELINTLHNVKLEYEQHGYYHIRNRYNGLTKEKREVNKYEGIERSAALILLNRTCFNGLYRVNQKGLFNVPEGRYDNPKIINEPNILNLSKILPPVENILNIDFDRIDIIKPGDFVYFDPPYQPLTKTSSFAEYSGSFGESRQIDLYNKFKELDEMGVYVILSNSSSEFIYDLYKEFEIVDVFCGRNINSKGSGRGKVKEVIVLGNTIKKILDEKNSDI